jgi:hypothetical protein
MVVWPHSGERLTIPKVAVGRNRIEEGGHDDHHGERTRGVERRCSPRRRTRTTLSVYGTGVPYDVVEAAGSLGRHP